MVGSDAGPVLEAEVDLRPIATGTALTFTHALRANEAERLDHEQGWNGALDELRRLVAGRSR